jgi:hypothetical protein
LSSSDRDGGVNEIQRFVRTGFLDVGPIYISSVTPGAAELRPILGRVA